MRALVTLLILLVIPVLAHAQAPGADSLADWEPPSEVATYTDGSDTLHVLGDSTWVALQKSPSRVTIGCELGPEGEFWVTKPKAVTKKWVTQADTTLQYEDLQATYECIDWVQWLWQKKEGFR